MPRSCTDPVNAGFRACDDGVRIFGSGVGLAPGPSASLAVALVAVGLVPVALVPVALGAWAIARFRPPGLTLPFGETAHSLCRAVEPDDEGAGVVEEVSIGEFARRSRLSIKALRLYGELGVLAPARVDTFSGYRYYHVTQLETARLVSMLRQLGFPLAAIRELLACDPGTAAERIATRWQEIETVHAARRELADYLVNLLTGKRLHMYEVATRELPERALLCLKRHVDQQGAWALGKEFIAILRQRPLPKPAGREGAMFSIYWGEVSDDGDGPVEWCWPIPASEATELSAHYPELTLRSEPAHREAYVALPNDALPTGPTSDPGPHWQLASEAIRAWAAQQGLQDEALALRPEDLGVRVTYLATGPVTPTSAPYCDFAVPFA
jgi:DNA-binding transcriptional MerR regulator